MNTYVKQSGVNVTAPKSLGTNLALEFWRETDNKIDTHRIHFKFLFTFVEKHYLSLLWKKEGKFILLFVCADKKMHFVRP